MTHIQAHVAALLSEDSEAPRGKKLQGCPQNEILFSRKLNVFMNKPLPAFFAMLIGSGTLIRYP